MDTNDSEELEALFDSIASVQEDMPAAPQVASGSSTGDDDELQALFDSIAKVPTGSGDGGGFLSAAGLGQQVGSAGGASSVTDGVYQRVGKMARELHDALKEMGYDKVLESTMSAIPDARDRLAYVANLTEQAASRVLNATDVAQPLVGAIQSQSQILGSRWDEAFSNNLDVAGFKQLAQDTRGFLKTGLPVMAAQTNAQLLEIMMAQDFQDLTGQVIKKIVALAQTLEDGLVKVLVEVMPESCRQSEQVSSLLNGPVITAGRADVVVNQQQVDDLLDTLGF